VVVSDEVKKWLDIAMGIDQVARVWIDFVLTQAALCASDPDTIKWLENSKNTDNIKDSAILRRIILTDFALKNEMNDQMRKQTHIESIRNKVDKLLEFREFNETLISLFENEITKLESDDVME